MSGFLKIMSGEPIADSDPFKGFKLISLGDGSSVEFQKNGEGFDVAVVSNPLHADEQTFLLDGNAYVLSNSGKTIASHGTNVTRVGDVVVLGNPTLASQLAMLSSKDLNDVFARLANATENDPTVNFITALGEFLKRGGRAGNNDVIKMLKDVSSSVFGDVGQS